MNGRELLDFGTRAIGGVDIADQKYFFDCINQAAADFVRETKTLTGCPALQMIVGTATYPLPPDFMELHVKDDRRRLVARWTGTDGRIGNLYASTTEKLQATIPGSNRLSTPDRFAVSAGDTPSPVILKVDREGSSDQGEAILYLAEPVPDIFAGDSISNLTDESDGIVLSVSGSTVRAALFNGAENIFRAGDEVWLYPQPRPVIIVDPAPAEAGTVTLSYIRRPKPVYSRRGILELPPESCRAICHKAAYYYIADYDLDPQRDAHLLAMYEDEVKRHRASIAAGILQGGRYPYRR